MPGVIGGRCDRHAVLPWNETPLGTLDQQEEP